MTPCRIWTGVIMVAAAIARVARAADENPEAAAVEALVAELGADDYAVREAASRRLEELGMRAADSLLTAAETSADLEVALRARWLVESLPLAVAGDAPEAAALVERFGGRSYADRIRVMHRLVRLDDDAGIEPLARIVQLERTAAGSRVAAALLVREWQPDDPYWPAMSERILAGLGRSRRPAARFLRALVAHSRAGSPADASTALDEAVAAAAGLAGGQAADEPVGLSEAESLGIARTGRIFRRTLAWLLARAGRSDEALAEARRILASAADEADPDEQLVSELEWFAGHGLPQAVDLVADRLAEADVPPLVAYAAALAWRKRPEPDAAGRAAALAAAASRGLDAADGGRGRRLQAAVLLAGWGAADWALGEYRRILEDEDAPLGQRALAAILCSEFLHEQGRDAEAAEVLAGIMEPADDMTERMLEQLERDPRAVRSRMLYFRACAAAEPAARRRLLEESVRAYSKDVDTLIALYQLPDNTPAQRAEAAARVARAADGIEAEIAALPGEPSGRNEYAWLVANTQGDLARATRYSRESLEASFDNASYLDTLAHCHAAAGDLKRAIRTQWLAVRQEPHSRLIRSNYDRFVAQAAAAGPPPAAADPRGRPAP